MEWSMNDAPTSIPTELARRLSEGLDLTLIWMKRDRDDRAVVCLYDWLEGAYFEIGAKRHLALDVYYHPSSYRNASGFDHQKRRWAA